MTELHDPDRIPRRVVLQAASVVGIAILASVLVALYMARGWLGEAMHIRIKAPPQIETVEFRAETEAEIDRREAKARLSNYGWVDRDRGIIHVPLDVAIQLMGVQ